MTPLVLQTDIAAARKMLADGHPKAEVVNMLVQRRIDPAKAGQVVDDLQEGVEVQPDMQANQEAHYKRHSRRRHHSHSDQANPGSTPRPHRRRHRSRNRGELKGGKHVVVLLVLVLVGITIYFGFIRDSKPTRAVEEKTPAGGQSQTSRFGEALNQ